MKLFVESLAYFEIFAQVLPRQPFASIISVVERNHFLVELNGK